MAALEKSDFGILIGIEMLLKEFLCCEDGIFLDVHRKEGS